MSDARDAFVDAARGMAGLTDPDPRLGTLVDPAGSPAHQVQIERLSLCMLAYRGLLCRVLAIPDVLAETDRPYVPGSIPRILASILASAPGARRPATLDAPPQLGDALCYGAANGHPEHVDACLVEAEGDSEGAIVATCVAGGQRDAAGHETIARVDRDLVWDGRRWVDQGTGRPVLWILDADALAERYGLREPAP